jgi:hypothetical protein
VQKLTQGKIFEHPGTSLLRSADARGEIAKEMYVKTITSLEFVGVTTRPWSELEDLRKYTQHPDATPNMNELFYSGLIMKNSAKSDTS